MKRLKFPAAVLSLLVLVAGCSSVSRTTKVTAFHTMPARGAGETFMVLPIRSNLVHSIEAATYLVQIANELQRHGYQFSASTNQLAKLLVGFDYGTGAPFAINYSIPMFGQVGGGYQSYSGSIYTGGRLHNYSGSQYTTPTYGYTEEMSGTSIEYPHYLNMFILDCANSTPTQPRVIYEGRAQAVTSSGNLSEAVPVMIRKMFADFPGTSGKTR